MATVASRPVTPEDLLKITDRLMPELIGGHLVEREPLGQRLDAFATRVVGLVGNHAEAHDLGLVNGAQGSYQIFPGDPNRVRIPDGSFTRKDRLPPHGPAEGHARVAPDLIIEVISPNDSALDLDANIEDFLAAGVPLIWVFNPETRTIQVHRGNGSDSRIRPGAILDGEAVLPGFRCDVSALFEGIA